MVCELYLSNAIMKKTIKTLKVLSIKLGRPFLPIAHTLEMCGCVLVVITANHVNYVPVRPRPCEAQ